MSAGYYMLEVVFDLSQRLHWWTVDFATVQSKPLIEAVAVFRDYEMEKPADKGVLYVRDRGNVMDASYRHQVLVVRGAPGIFEVPEFAGKYVGHLRSGVHSWHVFQLREASRESARHDTRTPAEEPAPRRPMAGAAKIPSASPRTSACAPPPDSSPPVSEELDIFAGMTGS